MKYSVPWITTAATLLAACAAVPDVTPPAPPFRQAVEAHLAAINLW